MNRFPDNARVCWIGDSITHSNNYCSRIIAHYQKQLPNSKIKFWNCGLSGGTARSALLYFEDDVLPIQPTHAVVLLGVNDSRRDLLIRPLSEEVAQELEIALENYVRRMNQLCDRLLEKGVSVILCTPAPYAELDCSENPALKGGYRLVSGFAEAVRQICCERGLDCVDYHDFLSQRYLKEKLYNPDHVHPVDLGHYRLAECFLKAQGLEIGVYEPIEIVRKKAGLVEWNQLVQKKCDIYSAEWMIINNYTRPTEEKMQIVRDYLEQKKWGDSLYFKGLSERYLENKPNEKEIRVAIDKMTENFCR